MDPWGNAAAQYNQGLGQLAQINQQGYQAQAQGPASIYDRFLQGYVQAKQMKMQEETAKREQQNRDRQTLLAEETLRHNRSVEAQAQARLSQQDSIAEKERRMKFFHNEVDPNFTGDPKAVASWIKQAVMSGIPEQDAIEYFNTKKVSAKEIPIDYGNPAASDALNEEGMFTPQSVSTPESYQPGTQYALKKAAQDEALRQHNAAEQERILNRQRLEQQGKETNDLRRDLGNQANDTRLLVAGMIGGLRRDQYQDKKDEKKKAEYNKDYSSLVGSFDALDRLSEQANKVLKHPGLGGVTGIRGKIPDVPGSDAANARAELEALQAQVGFAVLQNMRNNSRTGGALGNVSDAEGKRLEAALGAIKSSQSEDQLRANLKKIADYSATSKDNLTKVFKVKHGGGEDSITDAADRREPPVASDSKKFTDNGTTYTIPLDKVGKFKLDHPKAKEL